MHEQTFLVLSDIHYGMLGSEPSFQYSSKVDLFSSHCPAAGIALACRDQKIDAILAPGDLTSVGSPSEFYGSKVILEGLAAQLGLRSSQILLTFGNHDVDWRIGKLGDESEKYFADPLYKDVARCVGPLIVGALAEPAIKGPVSGSGVYDLDATRFYVINSSLGSDHDQIHKRGRIDDAQLKWLGNQLNAGLNSDLFHVLLIHHHLIPHDYPEPLFDYSLVEEAPQIIELAGTHGIDLIIHGHCHHPTVSTTQQSGWLHPISVICCGSVGVNAPHRDNGNIPNVFHLVTLKGRIGNGSCEGHVKTFAYVGSGKWDPVVYHERNTPIDPISCFGTPVSINEVRPHAEALIVDAVKNSSIEIRLEDLCLELRCLKRVNLMKILKEVAGANGCSIHGSLDESILVYCKQ